MLWRFLWQSEIALSVVIYGYMLSQTLRTDDPSDIRKKKLKYALVKSIFFLPSLIFSAVFGALYGLYRGVQTTILGAVYYMAFAYNAKEIMDQAKKQNYKGVITFRSKPTRKKKE